MVMKVKLLVDFVSRHCERSDAIQGGLRALWIAARLRRSQ